MNVYKIHEIKDVLSGNPYVGRGIMLGKTADGRFGAVAYFIMGRSANSRNRVFLEEGRDVRTYPFDVFRVEDPSLIIYYPVRDLGKMLVVTNGDQTDTVQKHILMGGTFASALETREFEPDAPNYTPRISGICYFGNGDMRYQLHICKSIDEDGSDCVRELFSYPAKAGLGHFLHTYVTDGNPIPTFAGEPERIAIPDTIDEFTAAIWENLDETNKISLYTRYVDLTTGEYETRLINKNVKEEE